MDIDEQNERTYVVVNVVFEVHPESPIVGGGYDAVDEFRSVVSDTLEEAHRATGKLCCYDTALISCDAEATNEIDLRGRPWLWESHGMTEVLSQLLGWGHGSSEELFEYLVKGGLHGKTAAGIVGELQKVEHTKTWKAT